MKLYVTMLVLVCCLMGCDNKPTTQALAEPVNSKESEKSQYNRFDNEIQWGENLVTVLDCNICHTPKIMSDDGPVPDETLLLSGRPADRPGLDVDREELAAKGLSVAGDFTEWAGPWGVSYAANLTPDETGIGNWTEEQFIYALRKGKYKGLEGSRDLLPPMPWPSYSHLSDEEMKAIFAYLKSIKPIKNIVPAPLPPVGVE